MKQSEIDDALHAVIAIHPDQFTPGEWRCWGWGAYMSGNPGPKCADCGKDASLHFSDDRILCWRCAFWLHAGICKALHEVIERA